MCIRDSIGGRWESYQYEIVPVSESELPGQSENPSDPPLEETHEWDKIPMVMVDGKLYYCLLYTSLPEAAEGADHRPPDRGAAAARSSLYPSS